MKDCMNNSNEGIHHVLTMRTEFPYIPLSTPVIQHPIHQVASNTISHFESFESQVTSKKCGVSADSIKRIYSKENEKEEKDEEDENPFTSFKSPRNAYKWIKYATHLDDFNNEVRNMCDLFRVPPETADGPVRVYVTGDKDSLLVTQRPLMGPPATLAGLTKSSPLISARAPSKETSARSPLEHTSARSSFD
ncbi:hypothetical protein AGLY_016743 [Aphis glycines]|uniref:Uncharacterized protein n=1 Tax=Aphis glycines TaxID=307491 RepID=A0A6G0SY38_APHGL|nr:hypothetical protein AGLY_016743 [Aphis glycines]